MPDFSPSSVTGPDSLFQFFRAAWDPTRGYAEMEQRIRRVYSEVIHNWTAPDRHYHTLVEHLHPLVDRITSEMTWGWQMRVTVLAAFYHDVRMNFDQPDSMNVQESDMFWRCHFDYVHKGIDAGDVFRKDVSAAILATDYGKPVSLEDTDALALRNYDLAGLADAWDEYQRKGELVLEERKRRSCGATVWTPEHVSNYLSGQVKWLSGMLDQQAIYRTTPGTLWNTRELQARSNLGRDLAKTIKALETLRSPS